jgi:cyanocobalamin reductase (cyanide-eliminating) / alkylcobalamin dealkylase
MADWRGLTEHLTEALAPAGVDLVAPMQVGWYNRAEPPEIRLPEPAGPPSLAVVLGNTRAVWRPFLADLKQHPTRLARRNPLDRYMEEAVQAAVADLTPCPSVHLGHGRAGRSFSLQRAAAASNLVSLAPCHLTIHREVGLWLGLRAVLVFGVPGPDAPRWTEPSPCETCEGKPCLPLMEKALGKTSGPPLTIRHRWEPWLAMRDACPVGREHRYSERQVRYHYTVDRLTLTRAVGWS